VLTRIIAKAQVQGIATFVIYCALPALIVKALAQRPLSKILDARYLLAYGLASLATFAGALVVARRLQRKPLDTSALYVLGIPTANSGFIGYPVAACSGSRPNA